MAQKSIMEYSQVEEVVDSRSNPGTKHIVIIESGKPFCSCPGFKYHGHCHHLNEVDPNNIYSTVPAKAVQETPDDDKYKILGLLQDRAGEWITSNEIARETGYKVGNSQVEVRKAITILIELDNEPIISGHDGYKYAQTNDEIQEYITALEKRMFGLQRRITSLRTILNEVRK